MVVYRLFAPCTLLARAYGVLSDNALLSCPLFTSAHGDGHLIIITNARRRGNIASERRGPPVFYGLTGRLFIQSLQTLEWEKHPLFPPWQALIGRCKSNFLSVRWIYT